MKNREVWRLSVRVLVVLAVAGLVGWFLLLLARSCAKRPVLNRTEKSCMVTPSLCPVQPYQLCLAFLGDYAGNRVPGGRCLVLPETTRVLDSASYQFLVNGLLTGAGSRLSTVVARRGMAISGEGIRGEDTASRSSEVPGSVGYSGEEFDVVIHLVIAPELLFQDPVGKLFGRALTVVVYPYTGREIPAVADRHLRLVKEGKLVLCISHPVKRWHGEGLTGAAWTDLIERASLAKYWNGENPLPLTQIREDFAKFFLLVTAESLPATKSQFPEVFGSEETGTRVAP